MQDKDIVHDGVHWLVALVGFALTTSTVVGLLAAAWRQAL